MPFPKIEPLLGHHLFDPRSLSLHATLRDTLRLRLRIVHRKLLLKHPQRHLGQECSQLKLLDGCQHRLYHQE